MSSVGTIIISSIIIPPGRTTHFSVGSLLYQLDKAETDDTFDPSSVALLHLALVAASNGACFGCFQESQSINHGK